MSRDRRARSASARAWPCGSTRTSRSRAPACGWAAARSSSASTPSRSRRCCASSPRPTSTSCGFHVFAGSQNLNAEIICEAQRADGRPRRSGSPRRRPAPVRYLNLGGGFGIPYFDRDEPLDLGRDRREPRRPARRARSARSLPRGAGRRSSSAATSSASAGVYVTRVVDRKDSRGKTFLVVDGGLHHQLAASGNFGQVIRRNYPVAVGNRLATPADRDGHRRRLPVHAARPARRRRRAARRRDRRPDRGVPGRRLRSDRQPDRVPGPPAARRGAR